ncbi:MAG: hypothetical protein IJP85_00645 [Synergistaceae bacterium]|nr:hypothetical protein [Synergistaceae bacterium]
MPEDLDPITARLVSELSASILPALKKSVVSAIPSTDFAGALERTNRTSQELRTSIERAVRSGIDDSRAGRSMIIQSIGTVLEEVSALRKSIEKIEKLEKLEKIPELLENALNNIKIPEAKNDTVPEALMSEIAGISERIDTLTQGIKVFFETYAEHRENDSSDLSNAGIARPVFDAEALSGLEGLVRAEGKTHSTELAEFSREISSMTEENNAVLLHEVREAVAAEISGISGGESRGRSGNDYAEKNAKLLKVTAALSFSGLILGLVNLIFIALR